MSTILASTTFVGATLNATASSTGSQIFVQLILPSGERVANINGWDDSLYNSYIESARNSGKIDDVSALISLRGSRQVIVGDLVENAKNAYSAQSANRSATLIGVGPWAVRSATTKFGSPGFAVFDSNGKQITDVDPTQDGAIGAAGIIGVPPDSITRIGDIAPSVDPSGNPSGNTPITDLENQAFLEANQSSTISSEDYMAGLRSAGLTEEEISGTPTNTTRGIPSAKDSANKKATRQDNTNFRGQHDWRVRLSLAKDARYLYKAANPGILSPLRDTDGIIFPYMPAISVNYSAGYDGQELTHSNYKVFQYRSSAVDGLTINCDFTAQDTNEAAYLLAVIHFLRSVTKMFYGKDQNPRNGTPPPLCYLHGLGQFQFNNHPLVINSFTYSLPNDVDYVRCDSEKFIVGSNGNAIEQRYPPSANSIRKYENDNAQQSRNAPVGGEAAPPNFKNANYNVQPTYVPAKMSIIIQAHPIITRDSISNKFSVKDYATGDLYRGTNNNNIGVW